MNINAVAVVNKSTIVTDAQAQAIADALHVQGNEHVAPTWGLGAQTVIFAADGKVPDGYGEMVIVDDPTDPNALGYHLEGPNGEPVSFVSARLALSTGGDVLRKGKGVSVSSVASHEYVEMIVNPNINRWVDGPTIAQGSCFAMEPCDPCQGDSYDVTTPAGAVVDVSDFVTPNYFDSACPASVAKDWLGKLAAPFSVGVGGYFVCRAAPGTELQVFGDVRPVEWRIGSWGRARSRLATLLRP